MIRARLACCLWKGGLQAFFFEEGGRRPDDVPLSDLLPLEGGGPLAVEVGSPSLLPGSGAETCFVIARSLELGACKLFPRDNDERVKRVLLAVSSVKHAF